MRKLLSPREIRKRIKINRSTLNNYLSDTEFFPPAQVNEDNHYRLYHESIIKELELLRPLKRRPYKMDMSEIKKLYRKEDRQKLIELYEQSIDTLYEYLKKRKFV